MKRWDGFVIDKVEDEDNTWQLFEISEENMRLIPLTPPCQFEDAREAMILLPNMYDKSMSRILNWLRSQPNLIKEYFEG